MMDSDADAPLSESRDHRGASRVVMKHALRGPIAQGASAQSAGQCPRRCADCCFRGPAHEAERPQRTRTGSLRASLLALLLVLLLLLLPRSGAAITVGNIFSGPTAANALAVFWNPAAMTLLQGSELLLFGSITPIGAQYARDTPSAFDNLPLAKAEVAMVAPGGALAAVSDFGLRSFRFGAAFSAPQVEGSQWAHSYGGRPSSTRYYTEDSYAITLTSQLAAAWRPNRYIALGLGLDLNTTLTRYAAQVDFAAKVNNASCASNPSACRIDSPLPRENPAFDAYIHNQGHGWTVGLAFGLLATPWPWLRIGAGLHTGADAHYPLTLYLELPPAAANYIRDQLPSLNLSRLVADVEAVLHVPMMISFSVAVLPAPRWELALNFEWQNSSETAVIFANVQNDHSGGLIHNIVLVKGKRDFWQLALRAQYELSATWRLGWRIEARPSTRPEEFMTPISADFARLVFYAGVRWRPLPYLALSAEYGQYVLFSTTVKHSRFGPNPNPTTPEEESLDKPLPTGEYGAQAMRFGLSAEFFF